MRVAVKAAKGRRDAVPASLPTYEVDLTREEMLALIDAARERLPCLSSTGFSHRRLTSALAVLQWRVWGRE